MTMLTGLRILRILRMTRIVRAVRFMNVFRSLAAHGFEHVWTLGTCWNALNLLFSSVRRSNFSAEISFELTADDCPFVPDKWECCRNVSWAFGQGVQLRRSGWNYFWIAQSVCCWCPILLLQLLQLLQISTDYKLYKLSLIWDLFGKPGMKPIETSIGWCSLLGHGQGELRVMVHSVLGCLIPLFWCIVCLERLCRAARWISRTCRTQ